MKPSKKRDRLERRIRAWEAMIERNRLNPAAFKKPGSVKKN